MKKRKSFSPDPRLLWALAYVLANALAVGFIANAGELVGDLAGFPIRGLGDVMLTFAFVSASIGALLLFFNALSRVRLTHATVPYSKMKMGIVIAISQISFIAYVQQTGLFIAGSSERAGSAASAFWVIFNVDALFFVYYATCRDARMFKLNLLLWILSFMQRGWFAYLFFVVAVESFRLIRSGKLNLRLVLLVLLLFAAYPILDAAKLYMRFSGNIDPSQVVDFVTEEVRVGDFNWTDSLLISAERIVARIQVVSHAQVIFDNRNEFHRQREINELGAFWKEGIVGISWDRISDTKHELEAAQALAMFIAPTNSSWNVNPSLVGWLTMYEKSLPAALLYLLALCTLSAMLMQRISRSLFSQDVLWFVWLTFLIPGWVAQFVSFLLAMMIYAALTLLIREHPGAASVGKIPPKVLTYGRSSPIQ